MTLIDRPATTPPRPVLARFARTTGDAPRVRGLAGGLSGAGWIVESAAGRWILKRSADRNPAGPFAYSVAIQDHLFHRRFPAAAVVPDHDGRLVCVHASGAYFLQVHRDGAPLAGTELAAGDRADAVVQIGRTWGRMHRLLAEPECPRWPSAPAGDLATILGKPLRRLAAIDRTRPSLGERLGRVLGRPGSRPADLLDLPALRQAARECDRLLESPEASFAPWHPCHGDPNWENVVFHRGGLRAVVDFQNLRVGPRILDLGAATLVFAGGDRRARERFLAAYTSESGWAPDGDLLRLAMIHKGLQSLTFQATQWPRYGAARRRRIAAWMRDLQRALATA
jgi:Ser/Thr protein kinase RdoA (MazF antagonist)